VTTVRTTTFTYTFTNTATHLSGVIVACFTELLAYLGLDTRDLVMNQDFYESAIAFWIEERTLGAVRIEIYLGSTCIDYLHFPITYSVFDVDARIADGLDRIRRQKAKLHSLRSGCRFQVIVTARPGFTPSHRAGWGPLGRPLVSLGTEQSFGTVARAPGAQAGFISGR
jgi:hypothetical protein